MSHGLIIEEKNPNCARPLTIKHLLIHCRSHIEMRNSLGIPDNLLEAISPSEE